MQKREAQDPDLTTPSDATATPRASGEQPRSPLPTAPGQPRAAAISDPPPAISDPPAAISDPPAAISEPSDTLLSAGKPADKLEIVIEDRLSGIEERLRELDGRLAVLERKKTSAAPEPRQKPWLWIAFLIALVVVFQLLNRVR